MSHQPIGNHGLRIFLCVQISPWAPPSRLSDGSLALVSFLSGGYNLHRFSEVLHPDTFVSFIKQIICLLSVSISCFHKHLDPPLDRGIFVSIIILSMSRFNYVPSGDILQRDTISSYKLISVQQFNNDTFINSYLQLIITSSDFHSSAVN